MSVAYLIHSGYQAEAFREIVIIHWTLDLRTHINKPKLNASTYPTISRVDLVDQSLLSFANMAQCRSRNSSPDSSSRCQNMQSDSLDVYRCIRNPPICVSIISQFVRTKYRSERTLAPVSLHSDVPRYLASDRVSGYQEYLN